MLPRDMDLDVDSPDIVEAILRAAVDAYRESAMELESAWSNKDAGRQWSKIALVLEQAADKIRKVV